ncbi:DnaJ-domain-containing protein [Sanghuangporus baumii]|uniref:DnaJ-domain-containing protein n=1 Tax=Sanghuangporus baumii TaxID=108892 RepID=A0A9Q5HYU6_SANBA|nr:DnaJ-domain-containing protein [Sanghuangporus baumii]
MSTEEELNPYELLDVGLEATDQEIKSAYRKLSLKVHPDRKFHELNQAYELLLDPLRRLALTSSVRAKEARKARFAKFDQKRKSMQTELEEAERTASKRQKMDKAKEERERAQEIERIKEQGRKMREEKMDALRKQTEAEEKTYESSPEDEDDVPSLGHLDTTVKVKYSLSSHPDLTSSDALAALLDQFGAIDASSIVLSLKSPRKAPTKPPKSGVALVPFRQIGDAFAAVCASGRTDRRLDGVDISWAEGKEPPILGWLKRKGMLDTKKAKSTLEERVQSQNSPPRTTGRTEALLANASKSSDLSSFSSFPESFPSLPDVSAPSKATPAATGLDYESLTLMRLRQAERERLEKEIREQEAKES